ncbi:hypothetical protein [Paenibacillus thiaminolyticus]|uniref:CdiA C-terminal domain-containing protein n=1 Tax=Paenibacillus thiaminolyticus TaxID=49283 RepID=UPI0015FF38AF|nr:hypothetical protein [Paenibacillus thiaminolyticus]
MVDKSVIQPISKASELEVFKLDLLTTSYEQNVEAGRVAAEGGLVLVDTALTLGTASEYAIAKSEKLVKMFSGAAEDVATGARKLPDGGASGKIPLHPSISHHTKKKGPSKDGKFKTHAKSLGERFEELEAAIGKLLGKMPKDLADRMPFKVAYMQKAGTNQRVPSIVKNSDHPMYSKVDGGNGGGSGRRAEGTGKGGTKLTEPSLPNGGKPKGNYGVGDSHGIKKQNETADLLADQGYDIKMLDEIDGGNGYGKIEGSNPDFLVEGNVFDCYAPKPDGKVQSIIKEIAGKTKKQSGRIVLNLDNFPVEKVAEITETILRKANPNGDLKRLEELILVKDGRITRVFGG